MMMNSNKKNKRRQQQQQASYGQGVGDDVCCFHPREVVVGVCAHCLKERLLLLLAAAAPPPSDHHRTASLPKQVLALGSSFLQRLDSSSSRHHHRPCYYSDDDTTSAASLDADGMYICFRRSSWFRLVNLVSFSVCFSICLLTNSHYHIIILGKLQNQPTKPTDSFISIKFEDNGKATWDSSKQPSMVVVADPHYQVNKRARWRKQVVGRLLQLARWKTNKHAAAAAAAAGERSSNSKNKHSSRGRAGWIRTLTTRRRHWS
ncbi:hypothetical protein HU200_058119 [Digitaria exilis]|uniref:Uncharacterized protein n=1 Tax=Digitaria exilis TaxID=1010633 RepID=A0A835ANG6_9POAL|nr:hypothetical protein HU200_058119 [Digitaria exilis]